MNVGAVDSAGQNLGADGYRQTVQALDVPLGRLAEICRQNNVLLAVTADHGMVFPSATGKGGHSAEKYASSPEALRVPLVFLGPGVEELNLGGRWSEVDIAPTVLGILNISSKFNRRRQEPAHPRRASTCASRARPRAWSCGRERSGWPTSLRRESAASGDCRAGSTASRRAEKSGRCW